MIIGITGTNGAGKGTVVDYLVQKGFKHYSARQFIIEEIKRRGLPVDRSSTREVANDLRQKNHSAFVVESLYNRAREQGGNAIIESLRAVGEAEFLKAQGAPLLGIGADRPLRYRRSVSRGTDLDKVNFPTWVAQEEREWHNTAAHDMNVPAVMAMADYTLTNNGTLKELHTQIDRVLAKMNR